tara:strand:- start:827 stop:1195 length:369 start_codon:yes stop_codon:yes gene_type:complete
VASFKLTEDGNLLTIQQGATFSLSVNYKNSAGSTVDLSSGYTARMQGRTTHAASSTVFALTQASGITLGSSDPNIVIAIAATATDDFTAPSTGVYDLELEDSAGNVFRLLEGRFEITPEVSR